MQDYMPMVDPKQLCSALQLCSVRQRDNRYYVAIKKLDGSLGEISFDEVANATTYEWAPLVRTYSSGHGFFSDDFSQIYLVTTQKKWKEQVQFTGWSPLEDANKDVVIADGWEIKFHLGKIKENALIRAKKRVWVDIIDHRNDLPLVDRALMENKDEEGNTYRRLVCLLHYIVKTYEGVLTPQIGVEEVIWWQRYAVSDILERKIPNLAPNADIIVKKALEIVARS